MERKNFYTLPSMTRDPQFEKNVPFFLKIRWWLTELFPPNRITGDKIQQKCTGIYIFQTWYTTTSRSRIGFQWFISNDLESIVVSPPITNRRCRDLDKEISLVTFAREEWQISRQTRHVSIIEAEERLSVSTGISIPSKVALNDG